MYGLLTSGSVLAAFLVGGVALLGLAYVFGMVFPLLVMALAWDRLHLAGRRIGRSGPVRLRIAGHTLVTSIVNIAVAAGFTAMGGFVIYLADAGRMTGGPGFQTTVGRGLAAVFRHVEAWTRSVPEPILGLALPALGAVFVAATLRDRARPGTGEPEAADEPPPVPGGPAPAGSDASSDAHDRQCHPPARSTS